MTDSSEEAKEILRRADETLQTARHGYEDLIAIDRTRRFSGLRNLIVFGRSFTWVLQNLRTLAPEFDAWYRPRQAAMRADPLMRYFVTARNELEKQGKLSVSTTLHIKHFSTSTDMKKFGPPPPGAGSFFIGDSLGGTGWEVILPGGETARYYVDLPSEIGTTNQHFHNFPDADAPGLEGKAIEELCALYLAKLSTLATEARAEFLGPKTVPRPHLRLVK